MSIAIWRAQSHRFLKSDRSQCYIISPSVQYDVSLCNGECSLRPESLGPHTTVESRTAYTFALAATPIHELTAYARSEP